MSLKAKRTGVGPIRVTLPISVAYDLEKCEQALSNVAQMASFAECISRGSLAGVREFIVDPASLQAREASGAR